MFEIVEWFHKAFHTQSTAAFVIFVVAIFAVLSGGVAFVIDRAYKNSEEQEQRRLHGGDFPLEQAAIDRMNDHLRNSRRDPPREILVNVLGGEEKRRLAQQLQGIFSQERGGMCRWEQMMARGTELGFLQAMLIPRVSP